MENLYHVFYKMPALVKEDMYIELEEIANQLVNSGLLRIDADPMQNFTRFSLPSRNVNINFSKREIYDESLHERIYKSMGKAIKQSGYSGDLSKKVASEIEKLKSQLKKHLEVEPELEMQIARILVQSAHPVVIQMIMLEQVELFVSYGDNIGEVMDIVSWQQAGTNSGMQSTDGKNVAVFVSCGGNPLWLDEEETEEEKHRRQMFPDEEKTHGDGTPALARMMGIAGQETGHYSDIIHNQFGQQVGRYSANFGGTKANPKVNLARITDIKNINTYWSLLDKIGVEKLIEHEDKIQFYARNPDKGLGYLFRLFFLKIHQRIFIHRARRIHFYPINQLVKKKYLAHDLKALSGDMSFNLEPKADVYSSSNQDVEVAIACIEALARVPQQANKWGHKHANFFWRNLYRFYYDKVIPGCIHDYEVMSGKEFTAYPKKMRKYTLKEKFDFRFNAWKEEKKEYYKKKYPRIFNRE